MGSSRVRLAAGGLFVASTVVLVPGVAAAPGEVNAEPTCLEADSIAAVDAALAGETPVPPVEIAPVEVAPVEAAPVVATDAALTDDDEAAQAAEGNDDAGSVVDCAPAEETMLADETTDPAPLTEPGSTTPASGARAAGSGTSVAAAAGVPAIASAALAVAAVEEGGDGGKTPGDGAGVPPFSGEPGEGGSDEPGPIEQLPDTPPPAVVVPDDPQESVGPDPVWVPVVEPAPVPGAQPAPTPSQSTSPTVRDVLTVPRGPSVDAPTRVRSSAVMGAELIPRQRAAQATAPRSSGPRLAATGVSSEGLLGVAGGAIGAGLGLVGVSLGLCRRGRHRA